MNQIKILKKTRNDAGLLWHVEDIKDYNQQRNAIWRVISKNTGNPLLRQFGAEVVKKYNVPERNELELLKAVADYVQSNIKFFREFPEIFASPMRTLAWRIGDCDDKTILLASTIRTFRIPARLKVIRFFTKSGKRQGHVYPQFFIGNKWLSVETVHKWPVGADAEERLRNNGIRIVSVEYIGDTPNNFKDSNMTVSDFEDGFSVSEEYLDDTSDEHIIDDESEMGIDDHGETVPQSDKPPVNSPMMLEDTGDEDEEIPTKKMPASFLKAFPTASKIYIEDLSGKKVLFIRS